MRARLVLTGVLFAGALVFANAAQAAVPVPFDPGQNLVGQAEIDSRFAGKLAIQVESPLDAAPLAGYLPLRLLIANQTGKSGVWTLRTSDQGYGRSRASRMSKTFAVAHGESRAFDVLAPTLPDDGSSYSMGSLAISVSGPGVKEADFSMGRVGTLSGGNRTTFAAISASMAPGTLEPLREQLKRDTYEANLCSLYLGALSSDPLALVGVSSVFIQESEWTALASGPRRALIQWVGQGGALVLCGWDGKRPLAGLPPGAVRDHRFGAGVVQPFDAPVEDSASSTLRLNVGPLSSAIIALSEARPDLAKDVTSGYEHAWNARDELGAPEINAWLFVLFLGTFALLVGPVNILWFCREPHRQRLFWTTPLLSVVATALLGVVILVQDGIGGRGTGSGLVCLLPEIQSAAVFSEQVARTNVLMGSSFPMPEDSLILPVDISNQGAPPGSSYSLENGRASGDWFRSRVVQGFLLQRVQPTRARIELTSTTGAPELVSSIPVDLEKIFYQDGDGAWWEGGAFRTGNRLVLTPSSETNFKNWWSVRRRLMGTRTNRLSKETFYGPGTFYAMAPASGEFRIPTHPGIRWEDGGLLIVGPVSGSAVPQLSPEAEQP